jgi:dienelactone hydrolase
MPKLADFELRTLPGLWRWYEQAGRQMAFRAGRRDEAESWQRTLRETVLRLLAGIPGEPCDLDEHLIESAEDEGFRRDLVVIQTQPGEYMPCYVLIPPGAGEKYRPLIALHGHGTWGARSIIGMAGSPIEADFIKRLNYDYARQFALRGYMVFVPVLRGFAERMETTPSPQPVDTSPDPQMWLSSCRAVGLNAILCGKTLLGMRVRDMMRLIDYIHARPEPMSQGLGCVGLSGGGTVTLFTTALDQRISCAVVSGYVNTFRESIMSIEHCICNYVPGLVQYAEMPDIAGLIAPRPLLVEAGKEDPIFPLKGTQAALDVLRQVYQCFDASQSLDADIFEGVHEWSGRKAYDWLGKWL